MFCAEEGGGRKTSFNFSCFLARLLSPTYSLAICQSNTKIQKELIQPARAKFILFPYNCLVFEGKTRFGPVWGVPWPKLVLGNGQKRPKATGRNYAAGPFIHESGKLQGVKRSKFRLLRARLSRFSRGWPQKGPFGPFLGPGGSRADPKTPILPPCKNRR